MALSESWKSGLTDCCGARNQARRKIIKYCVPLITILITATVGSTTWTYAYGPLDRRMSKADGTNTIQYLYDNDRAVAEYNGSGTLLRKYIYGPGLDEPIMMIVPGDPSETVYYYHADHLGSVIGLTNDAGAWVEKYAYTLYGKPAASSTVGNPYMYTGRRLDTETGLYYYRVRYYDPNLRRFIETDPIGYASGMNLYAYVGNSTINYTDSFGLEPNKTQAATQAEILSIVSNKGLQDLRYLSGPGEGNQVGPFGGDKGVRYIYTKNAGWIDLGHFLQVAAVLESEGLVGWKKSVAAWAPFVDKYLFSKLWDETVKRETPQGPASKWSYEDAPSNYYGAIFYLYFYKSDKSLVCDLKSFFEAVGATDPSNAPNWDKMQSGPVNHLVFPQNMSFTPMYTRSMYK